MITIFQSERQMKINRTIIDNSRIKAGFTDFIQGIAQAWTEGGITFSEACFAQEVHMQNRAG